ncbi:MAG: RNA polymerase sigma factor [candidate division Zixibacteria bacterium]|nr:RNA polymerase sigma factor [candidate division Zixibacteria bacterium]MBU2623980.1 RNA polymerase sigma factor [candidate division Zixibacteria bacterium]
MDNRLVKALDGDEGAERELFQYLSVRFRTFAKRRVREDDAEDVAQQACLAVLRKYKTEKFTTGFEAWAYGVLKMEIRSHIRTRSDRAKRLVPITETDQIPETSFPEPDSDLKMRLIDCLRSIRKHSRSYARALNLINQGYKREEICMRLRTNPGNFYVILSRGRRLLRVCLEKGRI